MRRATYFLALFAGAASFAACSSDSASDAPNGGSGADSGASLDASVGSDSAASSDGASSSDGSSASDGASHVDAGSTGQWVMGYYVGYQINDYPIAQIDWTGLTHIIFSPMVVKNDLSLDLTFNDSNGTGSADATALATAAHAHGVKALLMLGGDGAGANIASAASSANRAAFVTKLLNAVSMFGYDGIDLDWEDTVNLDDLVALAAALRTAKPDILLSYPAGAINENFQTVDAHMVTLAASLDRFNVQTYYPSTALTGSGWESWFGSPLSGMTKPPTPIAIDDTLHAYVTAGIPKAKIGMGMSFYAICYDGGITGPRQATTASIHIIGGDNNYPLSAFFAAGSTFATSTAGEKQIDAVAKVPYLALANPVADSHCGGTTRYISYEDETSIIAKGTFSKTNGYGGIIIWTLAQGWLPTGAVGPRAQNAMMQALKTGFLDP